MSYGKGDSAVLFPAKNALVRSVHEASSVSATEWFASGDASTKHGASSEAQMCSQLFTSKQDIHLIDEPINDSSRATINGDEELVSRGDAIESVNPTRPLTCSRYPGSTSLFRSQRIQAHKEVYDKDGTHSGTRALGHADIARTSSFLSERDTEAYNTMSFDEYNRQRAISDSGSEDSVGGDEEGVAREVPFQSAANTRTLGNTDFQLTKSSPREPPGREPLGPPTSRSHLLSYCRMI
eukprot:TRINITY_DN6101_c0_g2_i3.p2 TRINITY_DN6101_c0_g2~~TRINITY_DN6101_c0_g2_i3.p2  ORF type:complete len:252 (+),score=22.53 TRINITY_DN6101_c0_g2_i3:43-756(+)